MTEKQVISKKRVADHGEVFTASREVCAMLDMVKQETERIDSRFLEPACGTGNFLTEILKRKLQIIEKRYKKSQSEYEKYAIVAISSIYGIDLLEDNIKECRNRLCNDFLASYKNIFKKRIRDDVLKSIKYILVKNILLGDALTLKTIEKFPKPIVFCEWSLVTGGSFKRRDFIFEELVNKNIKGIFSELSDLGESVFIPNPVKEFPVLHFTRLMHAEHPAL